MSNDDRKDFETADYDPGGEDLLAKFVCEYMDRLIAGEAIDSDRILREHPDLGPSILRELRTFTEIGAESVEATPSPLGTLGDFTLRRRIGSGGMGVVYAAWQNSLKREVALKVLPPGVAADARSSVRFLREAQIAAKLSHPHIVPVYTTGIEGNTPYYAMEYVEGETLAQAIAKIRTHERSTQAPVEGGAPPARLFGAPREDQEFYLRLARGFADVADGLQHAHARGVIHRDIKPSNLILDKEGRLRILDFGLARLEGHESLTGSGGFAGTPLYMSPEQARARKIPIDHRTDIYSLGATMYEVLTGRPPFKGKDNNDTLSQIIQRDPVDPRRLDPRIPRDLETIVLKCLRKEAADRFGTAEALAQDLRRFVRGDPIEARPLGRLDRAARRIRRNAWRIAGAGVLTLVLMLGVALVLLLLAQRREEAEARYLDLLDDGIDALQAGLVMVPGNREAEAFSLGILPPRGDFEEFGWHHLGPAIDTFRRAAEILPDRPEAYVYWSRTLRSAQRLEEARAILDESLRRDPGFPPALLLKIEDLRSAGRQTEAEALSAALERTPAGGWQRDWIDAHEAAVAEDWPRVVDLYSKLLQAGARPFAGFERELRFKRGCVLLHLGQRIRALRDFDSVREQSGGKAGPSLVLASAYYEIDERDEGWAVLQDVAGRSSSDAHLSLVAGVLAHYGEKERVPEIATRFRDPCKRFEALLLAQPSVAVGEEALAAGCDTPIILAQYAEALLRVRRYGVALDLLRSAFGRWPEDPILIGQMMRLLYFTCEYDELLDLCRKYPNHPASATDIGWAYIRKGELEKAQTVLTDEIERNPRAAVAFYGRMWVHMVLGELASALRDELRLTELAPGWSGGRALRVLYGRAPAVFQAHWAEVDAICAAAIRRKTRAQPRYLGFRALACVRGPDRDPGLALNLATQAVACAEMGESELLAEALAYLGEVRFLRGEVAQAIRVLERAERLPGSWAKSSRDLAQYRRLHFPGLASCASVDAFLRGELHNGGDPLVDLARVQAALADGPRAARAYLEARLLERNGRMEEALRLLEDLVAADPSAEPELVLSLADWMARQGRSEAALALIEGRFVGSGDQSHGPWAVWMRIGSEAGMSIDALSRRLSALSGPSSRVCDLLWLLGELEVRGVARINCGGPDYVDASGRTWGRDRLHEGGESYGNPRPEKEIREDRDLYYDHRVFLSGDWARNAYRILLPAGSYEVKLRFCATDRRPEERRFRLAVEGETILECIDLVRDPGIGAVREERAEVTVADGSLEILFEPAPGAYAVVNTIEVRLLPKDTARE